MDEEKVLAFLTELAELYRRHGLSVVGADIRLYNPKDITYLAHSQNLGNALDYLEEQARGGKRGRS